MANRGHRGALLFETFVALMVLSIGIVSVLRIFGESLFAGRLNRERLEVKQGLAKVLFDWFAYPGGVKLGEGAALTVPIDVKDSDRSYLVQMQSENLKPPEEEGSERKAQNKQTQQQTQVAKPVQLSEYYKIDCHVTGEDMEQEILELKTVIYKLKQPGKK